MRESFYTSQDRLIELICHPSLVHQNEWNWVPEEGYRVPVGQAESFVALLQRFQWNRVEATMLGRMPATVDASAGDFLSGHFPDLRCIREVPVLFSPDKTGFVPAVWGLALSRDCQALTVRTGSIEQVCRVEEGKGSKRSVLVPCFSHKGITARIDLKRFTTPWLLWKIAQEPVE